MFRSTFSSPFCRVAHILFSLSLRELYAHGYVLVWVAAGSVRREGGQSCPSLPRKFYSSFVRSFVGARAYRCSRSRPSPPQSDLRQLDLRSWVALVSLLRTGRPAQLRVNVAGESPQTRLFQEHCVSSRLGRPCLPRLPWRLLFLSECYPPTSFA